MRRRTSPTSAGPATAGAPSPRALAERGLAVRRHRRSRAGGTRLSRRRVGRDGGVGRVDGALTWPELAALLGAGADLCRPGHLDDPSRGGERLPDRRSLRPDRPAAVGAGARGRPRRDVGGRRAPSSAAAMSGWCRIRLPCLPCQNEGCERHLTSFSRCLDELTPAQVLQAVAEALRIAANAAIRWSATRRHAAASAVARRREGRYEMRDWTAQGVMVRLPK